MDILKTAPTVFAIGDTYQIMVPVTCDVLMWVRVGNEEYYDHSNGIIRSAVTMHRMSVPMKELDREKKYTVCWRKIIERKPYRTQTEEMCEIEYNFRPVSGNDIRAYHISDAHNMVEAPAAAAKAYEEKCGRIDFLIMNGDLPDHSGKIENFDAIYQMASLVTKGEIPVIFSRGNHDMRGIYAENLAEYTPTDRGNSYFTFRLGNIWGIVLDCGEDKVDEHEEYGYTVCCKQFRREQTRFIEKVISNAQNEYLADGIEYRLVIAHNPFTFKLQPPFDIEQDTYAYWAKLLKDNVKPDLMIGGHLHRLFVSQPGSEHDHLGQPCPLVVGSTPDFGKKQHTGCGIRFTSEGMEAVFIDSTGEIVMTETI